MRNITLILFITLFNKLSNAHESNREFTPVSTLKGTHRRIDSLNNVAHNIYLGFPDSAHKLAADALLLAEKSNYAFGKGRSFLNLGVVYWAQSYYPISIFYLKSAIGNLPKNQRPYLAEAYKALGRTYADLKEYKLALDNLNTAMNYAENDPQVMAEINSDMSYLYYRLNDYKKALQLVQYSLKLDKTIRGQNENIAILHGHLASIYLKMSKYKAALAESDTTFALSIKTHNRRLLAYTYIDYALADNGLRYFGIALDYAKKGIALSDSLGVIDAETKAFDAIVSTYELERNYKKALDYQKRYNVVRDSLANLGKIKTIKLVQNYYELNAKMKTVALMTANARINSAKIKSQHLVIRVLLISLIVVMIVLTGTYYFYKQKKLLSSKLQQQHQALLDQKQLIEVQTANLQKVNDLKDKLFAVIGHDLRSPVANLTNIIEMFEDDYLTADEVHTLMKNINPVVKGVELTLSNLVDWAGSQMKGNPVQSANIDIFLLGVEMEQTFIHALQLKGLEFINKAYPGQGAVADENHIKVILRNLISNAIKFTPAKGHITIATAIESNQLIVSIKDNGKGMSDEEMNKLFFINTHFSHSGTSGEKGTGIGLLLCKELVEINGGTLRVKSQPGKGSTFFFNLPLVKAYA